MKKKNLIKKVIMIGLIIILIELLAMLIMKIVREQKIDHIDTLNDLIADEKNYVGVGASDFNDSMFVDKKMYLHTIPETTRQERIIATQAKIVKYDENLNILWENTYKGDYDSVFYSLIKDDDGYVVVGSYVSKYEQIDAEARDAVIAKYDFDGNIKWSKTYSVLSDTEFYKVIKDGEDYIVIGQSIYENLEMGNHITGGGIIVRYSKDGEELAHNNYGGNKSGSFNDIIPVKDGYILCGKDAANYGIIVKIKKDFNREEDDKGLISKKILWQKSYSNTDMVGFTKMVLKDNIIYIVGAINVSNEKDKDDNTIFKYDAGIVLYDTNGKYLGKHSLENDTHHRFTSVLLDGDELILTGLLDVDNYSKNGKQSSFTTKYSLKERTFADLQKLEDDNNYIIEKMIVLNDKKVMIGTANTKCSLLYGCEYKPIITYYKEA